MGSRIKECPQSTFEVYMEVAHLGPHNPAGPQVRRQFPEDYTDQETLLTVPRFCFPFSIDSLAVQQVGQNFTFVLTDIESKQRFGFCRLSSAARTCYCFLSYLPWFEVFYKLLNIMADYTIRGQTRQWQELLLSLHTLPVPEPGVPVHLGVHYFFTAPDLLELPSIPENRNLTEYFVAVDVNNMLHLYASMLYERRILICCSKLSTLTACVHGAAALLCPMFWQHVYIPVLPQHLLDYCCAPMPYLIGVHSSLMEKVQRLSLDDVVVLNVDTNTLETPYNDLQSLPSDVLISLKSRLKKVSTTPGDGVARAFLKSQAALFGSYRNALQIAAGEPITFNEDIFVNHRSSSMKLFLHNAIQLQLFKQFIDGRLKLLNSGEGFNDAFEEEINMSEYAGSDKTYHQWLFTMKKGGGAIFNTVKTKANPAMKTVYKFAKDHAKMRIREVKSRLKQKEPEENGYSTGGSAVIHNDGRASLDSSTSEERAEGSLQSLDNHRPVTVHFGQARPPLVLRRPGSNLTLESSIDQPQPYHSLKEVDLLHGDEPAFGVEIHTAPPSPVSERFSNVTLLGGIFSCQDEPDNQPLTLTKSLEDLRTPKDSEEPQVKLICQQMDLSISEHSQTLPGLKLPSQYNRLWGSGQERDKAPLVDLPVLTEKPCPSPESSRAVSDPLDPTTQGNITIPRPHGRKTPELGSIIALPVSQAHSKPSGSAGGSTSGGQEFRQALSKRTDEDRVKSDTSCDDGLDVISLLDPLNSSTHSSSTSVSDGPHLDLLSSTHKPTPPCGPSPQGLPPFSLQPQIMLNPFAHGSSKLYFLPSPSANPFSGGVGPRQGPYLHTQLHPPSFSVLPGLYKQHPASISALPHSGQVQAASSLSPSPHSSHSLSSLAEPRSLHPKPVCAEDNQSNQDPFGDLLTLGQSTNTPKKVVNLQRRWETFD
ncbi:DENN domain-containing protein 1A isoform X3 [Takifugu flavidus]|uniref:DENN domain-containing protein 1A isoform X3 n=1 Tax=Takifugu flavidus TaxID=433684 RepID=UPI0025447927|nr:DENN domain-containing protein 1A isoform X3 [Takifugu flavidus]